jgi:hypothetical protein
MFNAQENDISKLASDEYAMASLIERDIQYDWIDSLHWSRYETILDFYNMYDGCFFE